MEEFAYNNGYQGSLKMSPFKAINGWSCNTHISWSDLMNMVLFGLDMLAEMEQEMQLIKRNLKETQDMKKRFGDKHRPFKEFHVGEHVYLSIKPKRSSLRIGPCVKLEPYITNLLRSLRGLDLQHIDLHCCQ